jgi:hypothetical protein
LAAVAAVVLAVQVSSVAPLAVDPSALEVTRIKGLDPHLVLYRAESGGREVELLHDGAPVHAGDVIQVGYVAAGRAHGVLLSIDGAGAVTLHSPADAAGSTALEPGGEVRLDYAFALDAAPAFERFFFVTSPEPLAPRDVLERARRLAADPGRADSDPLDLPADWEQSSVLLRKE